MRTLSAIKYMLQRKRRNMAAVVTFNGKGT